MKYKLQFDYSLNEVFSEKGKFQEQRIIVIRIIMKSTDLPSEKKSFAKRYSYISVPLFLTGCTPLMYLEQF